MLEQTEMRYSFWALPRVDSRQVFLYCLEVLKKRKHRQSIWKLKAFIEHQTVDVPGAYTKPLDPSRQ